MSLMGIGVHNKKKMGKLITQSNVKKANIIHINTHTMKKEFIQRKAMQIEI